MPDAVEAVRTDVDTGARLTHAVSLQQQEEARPARHTAIHLGAAGAPPWARRVVADDSWERQGQFSYTCRGKADRATLAREIHLDQMHFENTAVW